LFVCLSGPQRLQMILQSPEMNIPSWDSAQAQICHPRFEFIRNCLKER
jgi:hypothetical protein